MFIYFKSIDSYLTCDEYPTFITTEIMKKYNLEYKWNKWIKTDNDDGTFLLSYKYKKQTCDCDNSMFDKNLKSLYECFLWKKIKLNFKDGEMLYLQNSGYQDIVFVNNNVSLMSYYFYKWYWKCFVLCKLIQFKNLKNINK